MPSLVDNTFKPDKHKAVHEAIEQPRIVPQDYHSVIVDNREQPTNTLLQYVDGSTAKVIYFRQLLGDSESVSHFSQAADAVAQQYERIESLEILLDGSLMSAQSDGLRTTEVTGTGIIRPPLIPNVGDIILMDFGRGTIGWFNIINVKRNTHRANTVYQIEFKLAYEIRDQYNDSRMLDLNRKVVSTYVYSSDHFKNGQNPLLSPEEADRFLVLRRKHWELLKYWFKTFYNRDNETCLVPNQTSKIYDPFFMRAIFKWFDSTVVPEMIRFRLLTDEEHPLFGTESIWDIITNRSVITLDNVFDKVAAVQVDAFEAMPKLNHIRYSLIDGVIAPNDITYTNTIWLGHDDIIGNAYPIIHDVAKYKYMSLDGIQLVNQCFPEKSYVLSQDFYHQRSDGQSHLELQLSKYLDDLPTDVDVIVALAKDVMNWGILERYYYIPILLTLIHYTIRRQ